VQELVRKQEALRNEILAQQGIMMRLSREVASIKHERSTLAAIDQAMGGAPVRFVGALVRCWRHEGFVRGERGGVEEVGNRSRPSVHAGQVDWWGGVGGRGGGGDEAGVGAASG
jgi:hypothetical protein